MDNVKIKNIMKFDRRIVVFTGAGVSAESGIPTFRGNNGLWKRYNPQELANPVAFKNNPQLVWNWYNYRREIIKKTEPNKAHHILADMEKLFKNFTLITQNIDGFHQKAGNKNIIELHGNIWRNKCSSCGKKYGYIESNNVPICKECGGLIRPDVVWFGESLDSFSLEKAYSISKNAEVFIAVGTSAVVYPAAYLPEIAKESGAYLIEVNLERTPITEYADFYLQKTATKGMSLIIKEVL